MLQQIATTGGRVFRTRVATLSSNPTSPTGIGRRNLKGSSYVGVTPSVSNILSVITAAGRR